MVSDTPFPTSIDLTSSINNADFIVQLGDVVGIHPIGIDVGSVGRYIRIQKSGDNDGGNAINLKELQIFGLDHSHDSDNDGICDNLCQVDTVINDDPITSNLYEVQSTITSGGRVNNPDMVTFSAGDQIILAPLFEVESGAVFEAIIEGCLPN